MKAFARAKAMFAAIAAATTAFRNNIAEMFGALDAIGPYKAKRKVGSRPHPRKTTRRDQRAALKKRNRLRNRQAHGRRK